MKKTALWLTIFLTVLGQLSAQESLASMRRQLYENGSSPQEREQLWNLFKGRVYPLIEDMPEARLENNLNVLYMSMILLLDRAVIWQGNLYHVEIAEAAERNYRLAKEYIKTRKNLSTGFRLAYARLMMLITPIINRLDRSNSLFAPNDFLNQHDEIQYLRDLSFDLVKEDPKNPDHWMLLAEYFVLLSNHKTMTHSTLALRHLRKSIKMYEALDRKEDLAWAYLWESALFMRRSMNVSARGAIEKARDLYPKSFLVQAADDRFHNELPWM